LDADKGSHSGSDALFDELISLSAYLPSYELEAGVICPSVLGLFVGPGQSDCSTIRRFIIRNAGGERCHKTGASALDLG